MKRELFYDNLKQGVNENHKYIIRTYTGRWAAPHIMKAKMFQGIKSILTIKVWGIKGYK